MAARVDPDAGLVQALRQGEPAAAEQLVNTYGDRVYRLAIRITGLNEDAEEVAQDALWTAARKIDMFKGDAAFGSWLYRITANAAYQKLRARKGRQHELPWEQLLPALDEEGRHFEPMDDWSPRVDEHALQGELREVLTTAIEGLPPDYRTGAIAVVTRGERPVGNSCPRSTDAACAGLATEFRRCRPSSLVRRSTDRIAIPRVPNKVAPTFLV